MAVLYKEISIGGDKVLLTGILQKVYRKEDAITLVFDKGEKDEDLGVWLGQVSCFTKNSSMYQTADKIAYAVAEKQDTGKVDENGRAIYEAVPNKYKLGKVVSVVCKKVVDEDTGVVTYFAQSVLSHGRLAEKLTPDRKPMAQVAQLTVWPSTGEGHEGEYTARPKIFQFGKSTLEPWVNFKLKGQEDGDVLNVETFPQLAPTEGTKSVTLVLSVDAADWVTEDASKRGVILIDPEKILVVKKESSAEEA